MKVSRGSHDDVVATTSQLTPLPHSAGIRFLRENFRGQAHHYLTKLMRQYGDNFIIWDKYVFLHDAAAIRDVLETHNLEKTPEVIQGFKSIFYQNGGILSAPWKEWMQQRRMAAPALAECVIGELAPKFQCGSMPLFAYLDNAAATGQQVDMDSAFTAVALDIIGLVVLGRTFAVTEGLLLSSEKSVPFSSAISVLSEEAVRQMMALPGVDLTPPGEKVRHAKGVVDELLEECIDVRLQERADGNAKHTDLLNILLDAKVNGGISRNDVKGQLLTFIFAGHDTTAHTMTWLLWEVSHDATRIDRVITDVVL